MSLHTPTEPAALDPGVPTAQEGLAEAVRRKGTFGASLKAVTWAFFGVRRSSGLAHDVQRLNPLHVVLAGLLAAVLFVVGLMLLVRWVTESGVAA